MYITQDIATRIKQRVKNKKITMGTMLSELGLGVNLISHLAKGQSITAINLARIADYLDCSVDYLLGRTDCPEVARSGTSSIKIAAEGHSEHVIEMKPEQVEALKQALAQLPND